MRKRSVCYDMARSVRPVRTKLPSANFDELSVHDSRVAEGHGAPRLVSTALSGLSRPSAPYIQSCSSYSSGYQRDTAPVCSELYEIRWDLMRGPRRRPSHFSPSAVDRPAVERLLKSWQGQFDRAAGKATELITDPSRANRLRGQCCNDCIECCMRAAQFVQEVKQWGGAHASRLARWRFAQRSPYFGSSPAFSGIKVLRVPTPHTA